ncbi:hypothetical protein MKEN_00582800 [Mycena kentingensis (nom. inval.)]|nr:hypothetical protein MKEN_00582800 [Mycena kentingensis (nom. inval.)]
MLPPELFDAIIAQIDDVHTVNACSLVCKSWLATTRHRVFQPFVVALRPQNAVEFMQLLGHSHATIRPYIHTVELLCSESSQKYELQWLDTILAILTTLPSLDALLFENISWDELSACAQTTLLNDFRGITRLHLRASEFTSVNNLLRLVCSKPALQSLSCDNLGWEVVETEAEIAPTMLRHLRLAGCYERDILDWLLSHPPVPSIHILELGAVRPEDTHSIGRFLHRLGPTLHQLHLEFWSLDPGGDAEDFCARVDLAHNPALHTFYLDKFIHYSTYRFSSAIGWIPQLIAPARGLTRLVLGLAIAHVGQLQPEDDPIDWPALDHAFCHLPCVEFRVQGAVPLADVSAALAELLPRCNVNGALRFRN